MCPSCPATREEKDTTRGRARVLQEMLAPGGHRSAGARRRCTTRSTSACPARAARATARPASTWPPTRPRCCTSPTGAGCARSRTTRWAGCRAGPAWPPGAGRLVNAALAGSGSAAGWRWAGRHRPAPRGAARSRRARSARSSRPVTHRETLAGLDGAPTAGAAVGRLVHRPLRPAGRGGGRHGCCEAAGYRGARPAAPTACCGLTWITTGQLDTARRILARHRRGRWRRSPTAGVADRRAGAVLHRGAARSRRSSWSAAPAPPSGSPQPPARWPSSCRHARLDAARRWRAWRWSRSRTATTRRCWAGTPTPRCWRRPVPGCTRLGGCCGLAGNCGVERGHHDVSVAIAEQRCCPPPGPGPDAVVLADGFSCRTQLAQLAGRRSCTWPSCWPPRCPLRNR